LLPDFTAGMEVEAAGAAEIGVSEDTVRRARPTGSNADWPRRQGAQAAEIQAPRKIGNFVLRNFSQVIAN
jgi:hypothetical protein